MKKPILIVTSDRWSPIPYVVFSDEELIGSAIPTEWVDEALENLEDQGEYITRPEVEGILLDEFNTENSAVDEFWPEHMICRTGADYYSYDDNGMVSYIKDPVEPFLD